MTIIRLSWMFVRLCAKSIDPSSIEQLLEYTAETLCMLEKVFSPSLFDVMSHFPIHLVQQLDICGPVHTRWMYPNEGNLKRLKGYVRQRAKPEESMASRYTIEEVLEFYT